MSSAFTQAKKLAQINNKAERENVKLQAQYNSQLAQENRDWQEDMSNSAHQREIADLKAAGLNPVLSVTGGQGATTPSGSAASVSKANTDMSLPSKVIDMAIASMNNAANLQMTQMQLDNAVKIQQMIIDEQKYEHDTSSGNSISGQLFNFMPNLFKGVNNSFKTWQSILYPDAGKLSQYQIRKTARQERQSKNLPEKGSKAYYQKKASNPYYGGTDIDDLISSLNSGQSLRQYYKTMAKQPSFRKRLKNASIPNYRRR